MVCRSWGYRVSVVFRREGVFFQAAEGQLVAAHGGQGDDDRVDQGQEGVPGDEAGGEPGASRRTAAAIRKTTMRVGIFQTRSTVRSAAPLSRRKPIRSFLLALPPHSG